MTQPLPDQVPASEPDPLDVIAQASDLASLDEELNQLPQKYRDVLVMSYFAQQTNQEIADQLNESKGAVDGRIRDARRMLRVRLARRGVEVGVLAVATAYVQSSASAATPALIQKAISLGAPGMVSQELAALNAADVAHMKLLTSTGIPIMSKIGLTIAAGLILATGVWGMSHLAAFQDADDEGDVTAVNAVGGDTAPSDETAIELRGRTEASDQAGRDVDIAPVEYYGVISGDGTGMGAMSGDGNGMGDATPATKPRSPLSKATAEFSRRSASEVEQRLNELVHLEKVKNLSFPGENPLTDILEQISTQVSASQHQRFTILPDVRRLDEDSVSLNNVMIKDIELDGISLSSALDIVMGQTDPELTWIARNEVILITTESAAESDEYMFLRSYDITRLREITELTVTTWDARGGQGGGGMGGGGGSFSVVFEPSQFGGDASGMGGGGTPPAATQKKKTLPSKPQHDESESANKKQVSVITWEAGLLQTIQEMTGPPCHWFDIDGEGGRLTIAGNRLIVRQSRKGHEQVVAVLEQLEMAADDAAEER